MNEQQMLGEQVRRWQAEGRWIDRGQWVRMWWRRYPAYLPTDEEIAEKCRLFRSLEGCRGAQKRRPRNGKQAVRATAGL